MCIIKANMAGSGPFSCMSTRQVDRAGNTIHGSLSRLSTRQVDRAGKTINGSLSLSCMSTGEVDRAVKTIHASLMHVYYLIGEGWQDLQWLSLSLSHACPLVRWTGQSRLSLSWMSTRQVDNAGNSSNGSLHVHW